MQILGRAQAVLRVDVVVLAALNEPCATKKINVEDLRARLAAGDTKVPFSSRPKTAADMRNLFYSALDRAKVIGALFDEGKTSASKRARIFSP